jgi:hypothetical protein
MKSYLKYIILSLAMIGCVKILFVIADHAADKYNDKLLINTLAEIALKYNRDCPYTTEEGIRTDRVYFEETGKKIRSIVFEKTMLNKKKSDVDLKELRKTLAKDLHNNLKTDKSLDSIRNKGVKFEYYFFDEQHEELEYLRFILDTPIILWPSKEIFGKMLHNEPVTAEEMLEDIYIGK